MNGLGTVQLGDTQVGAAAAEKLEHHKSLNKTDLATAQGQAFSKMLLAAQGKGTTSLSEEPELEAPAEEAKDATSASEETAETADAETRQASATVVTLNPDLKPSTLATDLPVLSPQSGLPKSVTEAAGGTAGAGKEKSTATSTDKSSTLQATSSSQENQGKETAEAMLVPILPALPPLPPPPTESTVLTAEKGSAKNATGSSKGAVLGTVGEKEAAAGPVLNKSAAADTAAKAVTEKTAAETALPAQGQQAAWSSYHAGVAGAAQQASETGANAAGSRAEGTSLAAAATDGSANKNSSGGESGLTGGSGNSNGSKDSSSAGSATPDVVDASGSTQPSTTAAVQASVTAAHTDVANVPTAVPHVAPGAATTPGQTAMQDAGALGVGGDGLGRSMSAASTGAAPAGGAANAHTLLDSATPTGREGTWQISSNRVEAGFVNGQDSWTSVVAQRQQGHVTATLEMGSAAEHTTAVSILPQLNQHLADRQLPVDHLGASLRQQTGSDREAGAPNQGQQSNQSQTQSQRGQMATPAIASVASTVAASDSGRISIDGSRISVRA
jgi:hypothetical protein